MSTEKSNVSFMREYLKYVVEFEKYVYIWTNSMNYANNQMRGIYAKRSKLENVRNTTSNSLNTMDARLLGQQQYYTREAARFKKKATVALVILMIDVLICFAIGAAIAVYGFDMKSAQADYHLSGVAIILISLLASVVSFIFTFIGPVCLGVFCSNKSRCKKFTQQASTDAWEGSRRRQEIILNERKSQADNDWVVSVAEESVLSKKQEEISTALQTAKKNLANVYAKNILPVKYRSLNAAATLYEYLETGRCNTIEGHGGIYDTYETDLQRGIIIQTLTDIRESMYRIEENQQLLYHELQQANRALGSINSSLSKIEKTNAEIEKNTAISAVADQQAAASAQWMAWNTWSNGY